MGRKTKITREMILEAAYELLDESGIGGVAIKQIAAKLGCSTQPVSWQFGSMSELKKELYSYNKFILDLYNRVKPKFIVDSQHQTGNPPCSRKRNSEAV